MNWAIPYAPLVGLVAVSDQPASAISTAFRASHWAPVQPERGGLLLGERFHRPGRRAARGPAPAPVAAAGSPPGGMPVHSSGIPFRPIICGPIPPPWLTTLAASATIAT